MGSSLAKGISYLSSLLSQTAPEEVDAAYILLADQPAISTQTLTLMQQALTPTKTTIVLCEHQQVLSPPALFTLSLIHI